MSEQSRPEPKMDHDAGGMRMAAMMMLCCVGVVVLLAVLPLFPWPTAIAVGVLGGLGLLFAHQKLMGPGGHH